MTMSRPGLTPELAERMIAFADKLGPLANDAASLHNDLVERGGWGTGVTAELESRLETIGRDLRNLVAASR